MGKDHTPLVVFSDADGAGHPEVLDTELQLCRQTAALCRIPTSASPGEMHTHPVTNTARSSALLDTHAEDHLFPTRPLLLLQRSLPATCRSDSSAQMQATAAFLKACFKVLGCRQLSNSGSVFFFSFLLQDPFFWIENTPRTPQ